MRISKKVKINNQWSKEKLSSTAISVDPANNSSSYFEFDVIRHIQR